MMGSVTLGIFSLCSNVHLLSPVEWLNWSMELLIHYVVHKINYIKYGVPETKSNHVVR